MHAYVTGHTHIPELTTVDGALYANAGCGGGLLHRRPGRGPFPDAFIIARNVSWVELDAGVELVARLVQGLRGGRPAGRPGALGHRARRPGAGGPTVVRQLSPVGAPAPTVLVT